MPADDRLGPMRALALVLTMLGALLASACGGLGSGSLTGKDIDRHAQGYFQRGMELDSFRRSDSGYVL